jgi:hypothetical protein
VQADRDLRACFRIGHARQDLGDLGFAERRRFAAAAEEVTQTVDLAQRVARLDDARVLRVLEVRLDIR